MKSKLIIRPDLILEKIKNKLTLFDPENSNLITFNESGSYILNKFKLGLETNLIIEALQKRYHLTKDQAIKDLRSLTKPLLAKKILINKPKTS